MTFASIAVLLSCLLVLGSFVLLLVNVNYNVQNIGMLNYILVFVDTDRDPSLSTEEVDDAFTIDQASPETTASGSIVENGGSAETTSDSGNAGQSESSLVRVRGLWDDMSDADIASLGSKYDGDFWDFFCGKAKPEKTTPLGVVLTMSAAGSESSNSCVITQEDGNLKWGCPKTDLIRPKFSVLDPTYTYSLPDYQLACGAVDMLAHLCERYFTNTPDVALTDRLCEAVMKTIVDAAPKALADHSDYASHADLMWAGMLAHNNSCGIGRDQDWASHQIEHELSAFYDCAHGAGLAVVMPAWMEYVCGHDVMRFARFAVNVFGCEMDFAHPERTAQAGIRRLRDFFRTLGMPATLAEVGGRAEDIPAMVDHRCEKPNGFPFGGFVKIQPADMEAILRLAAGEAQ